MYKYYSVLKDKSTIQRFAKDFSKLFVIGDRSSLYKPVKKKGAYYCNACGGRAGGFAASNKTMTAQYCKKLKSDHHKSW